MRRSYLVPKDYPHANRSCLQYQIMEKGYRSFASIESDEVSGHHAVPYVHNMDFNSKQIQQYDAMSVAGRLNQVKDELTSEELAIMPSVMCQNSDGTLENTSFLEILRWWLAGGSSAQSLLAYVIKYKLRCGQSGLARKIFDEAVQTGKLSHSFQSAVQRIEQTSRTVVITTKSHQQYRARKVICTIPLNVLKDVQFQPPLSPMKQEAINKGHIGRMIKIHAEVYGNEWRTWNGTAWPGEGLVGAYGDGLTKAGNSHLVSFGNNAPIDPSQHPEKLVAAFKHLEPSIPLKRLVSTNNRFTAGAERTLANHDIQIFHDWNNDPYAQGAWCVYSPGFATKYLKALQQPHGDVVFCGADWANGAWRGFIDGAIEQALRLSHELDVEFRKVYPAVHRL